MSERLGATSDSRSRARRYFGRVLAVVSRAVRHPTHIAEMGRKVLSRFSTRRHRQRIRQYPELASRDPDLVLSQLLSVDLGAVTECLQSGSIRSLIGELEDFKARAPVVRSGAAWLELSYAIVRLARPEVVLETGVAHGFSTAAMLHALEENRRGTLASVDLPAFQPGTYGEVGEAIPERLRRSPRWNLTLGPDRRVIPELLRRLGEIDVCFYDSDKSYEGVRGTWELVWPALRAGGLLVLDDANVHDAFLDFCDSHGVPPHVLVKPLPDPSGGTVYVGLAKKPGP